MKKTLAMVVSGGALASIAFAQAAPAAPAAAKPAAPAMHPGAKPAEHMAGKPAEHMAGKPAEHMAGKPAEHMAGKPGEHMEHAGKAGEKPAAAPGAPTPPPELEAQLKFLLGAWKCDTTFAAGAMGPGSPEATAKSSVRFKKEMKGFFYQGDYEVRKSKTMPGFKTIFSFGYQPGAKTFVMSGTDDTGGAVFETSPGFQGDTMTLTGEGYMMGQKVKVRETMTKTSDKEVVHKFEVDMGKGFQPMGTDTCKK